MTRASRSGAGRVTRRQVLGVAAALPLAGARRLLAGTMPPVVRISPWAAPLPSPTPGAAADPIAGLGVLQPAEWRAIAIVVDAIFPRTPTSASGVEAGVLQYIHQALGGAPPKKHAPAEGRTRRGIYASLVSRYRQLAARLDAMARDAHKAPFAALPLTQRDALITRLASGAKADVGYHLGTRLAGGAVSDAALFEMVRRHAIEGYFADPVYGGNVDYRSWETVGHTCQMNYPKQHRCDPTRKQHP